MSAGDLDVSLTRLAPGVADLVRAADALVREVDPDAVWVVWPYPGTVGYGVGPAEDSEHHAHLATWPGTWTSAWTTAPPSTTAACSTAPARRFRKPTVRRPRRATGRPRPGLIPTGRGRRLHQLLRVGDHVLPAQHVTARTADAPAPGR